MTPHDPIHNPEHYQARGGIERIEYVRANGLLCEPGDLLKYLLRYPFKGSAVQDLHKANQYLAWMIQTALYGRGEPISAQDFAQSNQMDELETAVVVGMEAYDTTGDVEHLHAVQSALVALIEREQENAHE